MNWLRSSKHAASPKVQLPTRPKSIDNSLWNQAYQDLKEENSKLVQVLEDLLKSELRIHGKSTLLGDTYEESQISEFIKSRLAAMNDGKWRIKMGEHSIEVRDQFDRIVKVVLVAKDFVSSVASMDPVHAGLPWAGICVLLPLLTNDTKQRSTVIDGLENIAKLIRRYSQIEGLYLSDQSFRLTEDLRLAVIKLCRAVLEFEARAACQFSQNAAHQALRNIFTADGWDGILATVKQSETHCEILIRIIDTEDRRIRTETLEDLIAEQNCRVTDLLQSSRREDEIFQQQLLRELQQARNDNLERYVTQEESQCLKCLRTNDYELDKERNPDRIPGTCEWFLQHSKYTQWLEASNSNWLWVTADPGCGKSVLTRFLINCAKKADLGAQTICYFFFKDDNEANRSAVNALASILHQMYTQNHGLIKHALPFYKQNGSRLSGLFESLWEIFEITVTDPAAGETLIFLDALDECEELTRALLVRKLASFYSNDQNKGFLKLLITSRPSTPIGDEIWRGKVDPVGINLTGESEAEMEAIRIEIDLVIGEKIKQLDELRKYRGIYDSAHEVLLDHLLQVDNRTYLWVTLVFPELERIAGSSERKLLEAVRTVPKTVNDAYERILSRSTDTTLATKLLHLVLGAIRPLTLDEMNVALSITEDSRCLADLDLESSISFRTTVRDLCGLFVSIRDSRIYLLHQTAKEFLLKRQDLIGQPNPSARWQQSMDATVCNSMIAKTCFFFLSLSDFEICPHVVPQKGDRFPIEAIEEYLGRYPFVEYASNNWQEHVRSFTDSEYDENEGAILCICNPSSKGFQTWLQIQFYAKSRRQLTKGFNEYIIAAYSGLSIMFNSLDQMGIRPDATDYHSRGALWWALEDGHEDTACRLVMHDLVRPHLDALTVLQFACTLGHFSVVECLLQNFEVNGYDKASDGWTAVQRTAVHADPRILDVLLDHDTDKAPSEIKEIALSHAVLYNRLETVQHLIKQGVNLEARSKDGITVLYSSVANRNFNMAKLLLLAGAKPDNISNPCNKNHHSGRETALYKAVSIHDVEIVSLLLDHAADVEAKNRSSETALYRAVGGGHYYSEVVKILLKRGANLHFQTATGDTPIRSVFRSSNKRSRSIVEDFAKKSGLDIKIIAHFSSETVDKIWLRHLGIFEESDLVYAAEFKSRILESLDEGYDPNLDAPMFDDIRDCGRWLRPIRSAIICRELDAVHDHAMLFCMECHQAKCIEAIEACNRLCSIAPDPTATDEDYRVTEDQWTEMAKQIPIIEQILADTKELVERYFNAVDASMIGFYQ